MIALLKYFSLLHKICIYLFISLHCTIYNCKVHFCNCCLLFIHWSPLLQYNRNDFQFIFYQNGQWEGRGRANPTFAPSDLLMVTISAATNDSLAFTSGCMFYTSFYYTIDMVILFVFSKSSIALILP